MRSEEHPPGKPETPSRKDEGANASSRRPSSFASQRLQEGEDYYREGAMLVFTARYHLKRGYCCANMCRHCPYDAAAIIESETDDVEKVCE